MSKPDEPEFRAPRRWQTEEVAVQKLAARARMIAASILTPCSARSRHTRSFLRYVQPVRLPNLPADGVNLAGGGAARRARSSGEGYRVGNFLGPGPAAHPPEGRPDSHEHQHGDELGPQVGEPLGMSPALGDEVAAEPRAAEARGDELDAGHGH